MTRILIPTDFSSNAMHAATYAVRLFGKPDTHYILVHTHSDIGYAGPVVPNYGPELIQAAQDGLALFGKQFKERTGAINTEQHVLFGPLSLAVKEFAVDKGVDLIVMGKRGGTGSALFGSNTTDVIKGSRVPVLAVPEHTPLHDPKRILLADDHDDLSPSSLGMLRHIALLHASEVMIMHVPVEAEDGDERFGNAVHDIGLKGVPHTYIEGRGDDVVDGVERLAQRKKADMIAVLHRHTGLLERMFHASVAKELALEADLPLLVLQQKS